MFDHSKLLTTFVEVKLKKSDDFLKVKETLTRIGIAARNEHTLYQSCHILHKQGRYYITHFKQMFLLDGKPSDFTDDDKARLNTISNLLEEWGLIEIINPHQIESPRANLSMIKILPYKQKNEWTLCAKYQVGKKRKNE